jgi:hypothetical protein
MAMSPLNIENSPEQRSAAFLVRFVDVAQKPAASPDNLASNGMPRRGSVPASTLSG